MSTAFALQVAAGTRLQVLRWLPDGPPRAIVWVAHGMAEHAGRYDRFAQALTAAGYAVYAGDHRGHGATAADADVGYFADTNGWDTVVADLAAVRAHALAEHPQLPVVLFGHSMGSTLARTTSPATPTTSTRSCCPAPQATSAPPSCKMTSW